MQCFDTKDSNILDSFDTSDTSILSLSTMVSSLVQRAHTRCTHEPHAAVLTAPPRMRQSTHRVLTDLKPFPSPNLLLILLLVMDDEAGEMMQHFATHASHCHSFLADGNLVAADTP